jgi:hypothetical protein
MMKRGYLEVIEQNGINNAYEQRSFGFSTQEDAEQAQILLQWVTRLDKDEPLFYTSYVAVIPGYVKENDG